MDSSIIVGALEAQVVGRIALELGFTHIDGEAIHFLKEILSLSILKTLVGIRTEGEQGHRATFNIFDVLDSMKTGKANPSKRFIRNNGRSSVSIGILLSFLKGRPFSFHNNNHFHYYNNYNNNTSTITPSKCLLRSAYDLDSDVWRVSDDSRVEYGNGGSGTFSPRMMGIIPSPISHTSSLSVESVSMMLGDAVIGSYSGSGSSGEIQISNTSSMSDSGMRLPKIKDQTSTPRPSYMAEHLPSLPPPYTYLHTDTWATREGDRVIMAKIKAEQQRQIEQNLFNLLKKTNQIKDIINYDELS